MNRPKVMVSSGGQSITRSATDEEMMALMRSSVHSHTVAMTRALVSELLSNLGPERWILYMELAEQLKDLEPELASAIAELINKDVHQLQSGETA